MRLFGLDIIAASFSEAVAILTDAVASRRGPAGIVSTPNVDHVVRLDKQPDLQPIYRQAAYLFADGMPIVWASRLLGRPLPERVTGSDLFVALCRQAVAHGWKIAILGGMPGDGPMLESRFAATYPGIDVTVMTPSMRFDPLGDEGREAADRIRALAPDLVFVCLGMPKQETWAGRYAATLPTDWYCAWARPWNSPSACSGARLAWSSGWEWNGSGACSATPGGCGGAI